MVIVLQSLSFVVRNTSPIGWVPILIVKALEIGFMATLSNYILGFITIFLPMFSLATFLDSKFYGTLTIVPWNFIKVNVFEGLSQTFGSDPMGKYILQEIPVRFNVLLPALILGLVHHYKVCRSKNMIPFLLIYIVSIVGFLSLITHKEPKFLLPVFPAMFIVIGQYL